MKLLKQRNDNELKLQSEILDKNGVIKGLTKKLKESTAIILQINEKNAELNQNYQNIFGSKLKEATHTLETSYKAQLRQISANHQDDIHAKDQIISDIQRQLKEA